MIFFARDKKNVRVACKMIELGTDWEDSRVKDMKVGQTCAILKLILNAHFPIQNELFIMEKVKHLYVVKLFKHFLTQSKKYGIN